MWIIWFNREVGWWGDHRNGLWQGWEGSGVQIWSGLPIIADAAARSPPLCPRLLPKGLCLRWHKVSCFLFPGNHCIGLTFEVERCLLQHEPGRAAHRAEHADQADQDEPQQDQGGRRLLPVLRAPRLHRPLQQHNWGYRGQELCSTGTFKAPTTCQHPPLLSPP